MDKEKSESRIIKVFKYFIQFLEIYGAENYGQSAEVNWETVWNFVNRCGILDSNIELETLVHYSTDEEFRDGVFTYIEKQALDGYPLWRLFTMSKWLYNKCEQELHDIEYKKDIEYFNTVKCYRCKNFHNRINTIGHTVLEPIMSKFFNNVEELKNYIRDTNYVVQKDWQEMNCMKRKKLLENKMSHGRHRFYKNECNFKYKGFNVDNEGRSHNWILNPMKLLDCPYFEENKNMTINKFIEIYGEIPRYI